MCRGFESLLRYHLSPHSFHAIRIGVLSKECRQPPRDFNLHASESGRIPEDSNSVDKFANGSGTLRIPFPNTLAECLLQPRKLPLIPGKNHWRTGI